MSETIECMKQYCRDGDPEAFSRLVSEYRPMVEGICRRYVIEPGDVEDAVQETFVKLARRAEGVTGDVGAWLGAVAGTTALDYARRSLRERSRRRKLAEQGYEKDGEVVNWRGLEQRLQEALEGLDPVMQSLVLARYFTGNAVKEMAKRSGVNSSTMSRRVTQAVGKVKRALEAMGYRSVEEMMVGEEVEGKSGKGRMGFAAGKIRVGVLVSHLTTKLRLGPRGTVEEEGFQPTERVQLRTASAFAGPRCQLISLVEPGTEDLGVQERAIREQGITHGMMDATDVESLKLLDVIVLGHNYAVTTRMLDAVAEAVQDGVGLYNEGHVGTLFPGVRDARVCRLLLTDKFASHHTKGAHNLPRPATVMASHAILAGVPVGTGVMIDGCGPVFRPQAGAKVLVMKDEPVNPEDPVTPELNGLRMPALVVGQMGRGRVAIVTMRPTTPMQELAGLRGNFVHNVFDWLAEERVKERGVWAGS